MSHDPQDLSQYSLLDLFRLEAGGQVRHLTEGLLRLESGAGEAAVLEGLMRAAHSIKGAAAIVGLEVVVELAHAMEDAFTAAQAGALELGPAGIDVLLGGVDLIAQVARLSEAALDDWKLAQRPRIDAAVAAMRTLGTLAAPAPRLPAGEPAPEAAPVAAPDAEPGAAAVAAAAAPTGAGAGSGADLLLALASETRVNAHKMEAFNTSLQRFKRQQAAMLQSLAQLHEAIAASGDARLLEQAAVVLARAQPLKPWLQQHMADAETHERRAVLVSSRLVDQVLALRMCPFSEGVHAFPRMVRDLARKLGKQVQLLIEGSDIPVDRAILARIESPLNHLLRNALDHGMEAPAERSAAGKPPLGTIRIAARHRGGMLAIEISDDGRGIDPERVRQAVVGRGLGSPAMAAALSQAELMEFLFLPGFSLKESVTEISGRGVGLDVVQQVVREHNGSVRVESRPGLSFRTAITLPLTQSIVRALVVQVQGEAYALPIAKVERVLRVAQDAVHTLENKQFFELDGAHYGLVAASQVLELGVPAPAAELAVVVLGTGAARYALVVDAIAGEQSLTVQSLDPLFGKLRNIAAGALLDDGSPVLLLDVPDLLLSIDKLLSTGTLHHPLHQGDGAADGAVAVRRILVVDDSLTVREMQRKLLAARGYRVDTAVDGMDGWNMLRAGDYDLLVTDIDMPRMDGIELVAMVRRDARVQALPVMIVSYKDRPEDRARGMDVGADYYLAKGSFHDTTLLDAVFDLIGPATP
ncbi:hybrid sensor histidine kinase/response regulator [Massilia sp. H6]|uniref:hybrid sensor histidine kinase/response regulator n=1 Tax=Massilia sp. H6 TaxID=2970464 RepID=UPI0021680048|nr:hybrid sensor histidine kinase/response regulator [Massilia sp. H6]UVW27719.1 hybrid sensor histidine kinase/response regulator [Massilia sp. H6]